MHDSRSRLRCYADEKRRREDGRNKHLLHVLSPQWTVCTAPQRREDSHVNVRSIQGEKPNAPVGALQTRMVEPLLRWPLEPVTPALKNSSPKSRLR